MLAHLIDRLRRLGPPATPTEGGRAHIGGLPGLRPTDTLPAQGPGHPPRPWPAPWDHPAPEYAGPQKYPTPGRPPAPGPALVAWALAPLRRLSYSPPLALVGHLWAGVPGPWADPTELPPRRRGAKAPPGGRTPPAPVPALAPPLPLRVQVRRLAALSNLALGPELAPARGGRALGRAACGGLAAWALGLPLPHAHPSAPSPLTHNPLTEAPLRLGRTLWAGWWAPTPRGRGGDWMPPRREVPLDLSLFFPSLPSRVSYFRSLIAAKKPEGRRGLAWAPRKGGRGTRFVGGSGADPVGQGRLAAGLTPPSDRAPLPPQVAPRIVRKLSWDEALALGRTYPHPDLRPFVLVEGTPRGVRPIPPHRWPSRRGGAGAPEGAPAPALAKPGAGRPPLGGPACDRCGGAGLTLPTPPQGGGETPEAYAQRLFAVPPRTPVRSLFAAPPTAPVYDSVRDFLMAPLPTPIPSPFPAPTGAPIEARLEPTGTGTVWGRPGLATRLQFLLGRKPRSTPSPAYPAKAATPQARGWATWVDYFYGPALEGGGLPPSPAYRSDPRGELGARVPFSTAPGSPAPCRCGPLRAKAGRPRARDLLRALRRASDPSLRANRDLSLHGRVQLGARDEAMGACPQPHWAPNWGQPTQIGPVVRSWLRTDGAYYWSCLYPPNLAPLAAAWRVWRRSGVPRLMIDLWRAVGAAVGGGATRRALGHWGGRGFEALGGLGARLPPSPALDWSVAAVAVAEPLGGIEALLYPLTLGLTLILVVGEGLARALARALAWAGALCWQAGALSCRAVGGLV